MTDIVERLVALANSLGDTEEDDIMAGVAEIKRLRAGWKEAAIAWSVCASIHREYAKGKDPLFKTRQGDFAMHADEARRALEPKP